MALIAIIAQFYTSHNEQMGNKQKEFRLNAFDRKYLDVLSALCLRIVEIEENDFSIVSVTRCAHPFNGFIGEL